MQGQKIISTIDINHYMIEEDSLNLVLPGDLITSEQGYMNGHGTYRVKNQIYASQIGTVETTNKLIIVSPLNNKYSPQIGDIVVGRVIQISSKRWKVDINASSFCFLNLNSTYLEQQRKKNQEDQFNMRKIMKQNDMIVAEVHSINQDKSCNLHTRNPKYGRLQPGTLVQVHHKQVRKQKHHMVSFLRVGVVLGNNGWIWLSSYRRNDQQQLLQNRYDYDQQNIKQIAVLHNIFKLLGWQGLEITELLIKEILKFVQERGISCTQILKDNGQVRSFLIQQVRDSIPNRIQQQGSKIKN